MALLSLTVVKQCQTYSIRLKVYHVTGLMSVLTSRVGVQLHSVSVSLKTVWGGGFVMAKQRRPWFQADGLLTYVYVGTAHCMQKLYVLCACTVHNGLISANHREQKFQLWLAVAVASFSSAVTILSNKIEIVIFDQNQKKIEVSIWKSNCRFCLNKVTIFIKVKTFI